MNKIPNDLFRLDDKVVVVTGATGLLGRKHIEAIAAYGGKPIIIDLSKNNIDRLIQEIDTKFNVQASGYVVDITNEDEIKKNLNEIIDQFGRIDCLVNNAANNPKVEKSSEKNFTRLENFPLDVWNKDIAVGLTGAFLCAKYYGNQISKNSNGGVIVNISSDLGLISPDQRLYQQSGLPESQQPVKPVTYSVVKTGVIGLTRYLATYWAEKNVRCNAICPGGVENGQPKEFIQEVSLRIPVGRLANANEYQSTLIWMLSDASSYLNGAIVPVEGGRTVW
jgi:NAD(P)-dependent dehydrogenase (short-subunit alcohol dehydrogenase family)